MAGIHRAVQIAHRRHRDDFHAVRVKFRRINLDFPGDDEDGRFFATARIQPESADAARDDEAHVAIAQFIRPDGFDGGFHHFRPRHRDFQQNGLGGIKEPVNVFLQFEHPAVVSADALEHAITVKQAVVEHGDFCVALAEIFAINKDFHAAGAQTIAKPPGRQTGIEFSRDKSETPDILDGLLRPYGLAVRTPPFHGGSPGSIPGRVAIIDFVFSSSGLFNTLKSGQVTLVLNSLPSKLMPSGKASGHPPNLQLHPGGGLC